VSRLGWIQKLYETYENNISQVGVYIEDENDNQKRPVSPLSPVSHTTTTADVEIVIDYDGNFLRASIIPKNEGKIIIPCSEASSGRTGKHSFKYPHPLCDKIQYVAGDYKKYKGEKAAGFEDYQTLLSAWANSPYSNKKIVALKKYTDKKSVVEDLIKFKTFIEDKEKGISIKNNGLSQDEAFIRWRVEIPGVNESTVWKDKELFKSWHNFYLSHEKKPIGYCFVLGEEAELVQNHPKVLSNAKIISSNDTEGFTYRGRFIEAEQACSISYEVAQKVHNALKWIIEKQGFNEGTKSIVCWSVLGNEILSATSDGLSAIGINLDNVKKDISGYTGEELANELKLRIQGYKKKISVFDKVVIMSLEAATNGRLSITYYQELSAHDYLGRIDLWHATCTWIHMYHKKEVLNKKFKTLPFVGAPTPYDIAGAVHGYGEKSDVKAKLRTVDRILPCIVGCSKIPQDLVFSAVNKTSNRVAFDDIQQFEKALSVTCALYNKYKYDYYKEVYLMSLEKERKSRDYLYGRLLAVAQNIEQWALSGQDNQRMTNADRLMQRFSEYPYSTWKNIELSLKPYFSRLKGGAAISREKLLDDIMSLFEPEDFTNDSRLTGEFLLGYHCQREDLRSKKNENREEKIQNENIFEEE
jgi:CRISPR-associated protein Csd1